MLRQLESGGGGASPDPLQLAFAGTAVAETGLDPDDQESDRTASTLDTASRLLLSAVSAARRLVAEPDGPVDAGKATGRVQKRIPVASLAVVHDLYGTFLLDHREDPQGALAQAEEGLHLDPGNLKLMQLKAEAAMAASAGKPNATAGADASMLLPPDALEHLLEELSSDRGAVAHALRA